jgi:hypothetical protein
MAIALFAVLLLTGQAAEVQPAAVPAKPRLVCRESQSHLGSRVRTGRLCKTPEQWAQEDAERERVPLTLQVTAGQGDAAQPTRRPQ